MTPAKTYRITMLEWNDGQRPTVRTLRAAQPGRNAIAALEAFVDEVGVAEHYSPSGRKMLVGHGAPSLTANLNHA